MVTSLNFKIKKLDNVKFNHKDLLHYYNQIVEKFPHLKWMPSGTTETLDHNVDNTYSWAIQSNYTDTNIPCPPYHIDTTSEFVDPENKFSNPTKLVFGFGKKIVDTFPEVRQTGIVGHPPGTKIQLHPDNDEFLKIHIPIITNPDSWFFFEDEKINMEVGSAYLVNTIIPHGTINNGDTDRIHLICKFPTHLVDEILNNEWVLDENLFNFGVLELDNVEFNLNELQQYYKEVEETYFNRKWSSSLIKNMSKPDYIPEIEIFGYAVLTHLKDPNKYICPPMNTKSWKDDEATDYATNTTPLMFGFAEKLYKEFPYMEEMVISIHTPGVQLGKHVDEGTNFRLHFPVYSDDCDFIVDGTTYKLVPGKAYIVNTSKEHGTNNKGNRDRVHLFFKVPIGRIQYLLSKRHTL
jgi:quercetin dioxygenase-like cupin family protein